MKYVINTIPGCFTLSYDALVFLAKNYPDKVKGQNINSLYFQNRTAPELIECVEKLGAKANGTFAKLAIVEVPDNIVCTIEEFDGVEWIAERHRIWDTHGQRWSDNP